MTAEPEKTNTDYNVLQELHQKAFGSGIVKYGEISSHGSDRQIIRLHGESGKTSIGIINENISENKAFTGFGKHFRSIGLNVPGIYITSDDLKLYILEDLGDETLLNRINNSEDGFGIKQTELYKRVIDELPKFQVTAAKGIDYGLCYQYGEFGKENIRFDLQYFRERFLDEFGNDDYDGKLLEDDLDFLTEKLLQLPRDFFLYRDFQGRNIMIKNEEFYFIDFQSGRRGSLLYDTASLLYNSRANVPQAAREELIEYYLEVINGYVNIDKSLYRDYFWYFAVIRILQGLGAYGFLGIVKGKQKFLESIPPALDNINFILSSRIIGGELKSLKKIISGLNIKF